MNFIRIKNVIEKTGLSRSTIYKKIDEGTFPAQVRLGFGARAVGWIESEVDGWAEEQIFRSRNQSQIQNPREEILRKPENSFGRQRGNHIDEINLAGTLKNEGQCQEGVL